VELARLKPSRIYVVGGPSVISAGVAAALVPYALSGSVVRLAGADRYGTAVAVSKAAFAPGVEIAYIAYGLNFPDALAGAAAAGFKGGPVLLTPTATLNAATAAELTRLRPKRIVVLGSAAVVSAAVFNLLAAYATGP
jgi:putative cell wall-binding protein